jgi:hypothetical protein
VKTIVLTGMSELGLNNLADRRHQGSHCQTMVRRKTPNEDAFANAGTEDQLSRKIDYKED